jgi:hypothetical protein
MLYFAIINRLYSDALSIISLTMFGNLLAVTYSPNVLFTEENTVSAIHLDPYLTLDFHLSKFFN